MPRPPSLSPELLLTFVTIIRSEGDATRAAEILQVNQPSMSKRLAFLQHAGRVLQRPWLERVGKKWRISEEGKRVYPAVEEIVHRYRLLSESISDERPAVTFACGPCSASGYVQNALIEFRKQYPQTSYRIATRHAISRIEGVANGSLDLAVVTRSSSEIAEVSRRPLFIEELVEDPFVMIAHPEMPDFAEFEALPEKNVPPKAYLRFPLILPAAETHLRHEMDRRFREAGLGDRTRVVLEMSNWSTMLDYVRLRVGVGILPRSIYPNNEQTLVKRAMPLKLGPPNILRVIARKRAGTEELDLNESGHAFLNAIQQAASALKVDD